jgi:hypothetical protein
VTLLATEHVAAGHPVQFVTASPFWTNALGDELRDATSDEEERMQRPVILRFASDSFMDDLAKVLADDPSTLTAHEAVPVSFRARPPLTDGDWPPVPEQLKLYTPLHGDFNLVAASLVCRIRGLPEHSVRPEVRERVGFVLRRLDDEGAELAWVDRQWTATTDASLLAAGEDVKPMFPTSYPDGDRLRMLFVGLIPTGGDEAGKNVGLNVFPVSPTATSVQDPRLDTLDLKVIEPLKALQKPPSKPDNLDAAGWTNAQSAMRPGRVDASRFLLLDLAEFLQTYLPEVWGRITAHANGTSKLEVRLRSNQADGGLTWADALRSAAAQSAQITGTGTGAPTLDVDLLNSSPDARTLRGDVQLLLAGTTPPPTGETPSTPGPSSANVPKLDPTGKALYRIRCVYLRPECGALHDDIVSEPTVDFQIASLFDPDAPARPIQITLPIDPKDLRGSMKNVSVLLSDAMRQQVSRATDIAALMKGTTGSDTFDVGLVCSFSIPIITICALIMLMIIVGLLNIVFWWMPFLRICFPIGLKAGSSSS